MTLLKDATVQEIAEELLRRSQGGTDAASGDVTVEMPRKRTHPRTAIDESTGGNATGRGERRARGDDA